MKRVFLLLAIAGVLSTACNKKNTPPEEPVTTDVSRMDEEELARLRQDKARMKAELDARKEIQREWEKDQAANKKETEAKLKTMQYLEVVVMDGSALAGCSWLLQLKNGKKVNPDYIPPAHREQGKTLWVKYEATEEPTTCQQGKAVKMLDIQWQKPKGDG